MLVTETGAVIPIDTIAVVSGKGLSVVIEIDCSCDAMEQPTSHLEKYRISQMDHGILFPKSQLYLNGTLTEELELIEIVMPPTFLTAADDGSEIELKKGQLLVITLEANLTTGYTWEVAEPLDERVIRQVGEIEFVPESDLIGAGGVQIIKFEGVGADQTTIKLVYHRPWETEVELTLGTFSVQVVVH
jgi:predicted secreted protein